jgi:hypothetical protein
MLRYHPSGYPASAACKQSMTRFMMLFLLCSCYVVVLVVIAVHPRIRNEPMQTALQAAESRHQTAGIRKQAVDKRPTATDSK